MEIDRLKELVEYARSAGLKRVSLPDGTELELGDAGPPRKKLSPEQLQELSRRLKRRKYTEADIALWSTMEELPTDRAERLARELAAQQTSSEGPAGARSSSSELDIKPPKP